MLDERALDALYRSHGALVRRRARALLGNDEDALDAVQEIFMSLTKRPEQFHGRSSAATFLYAMTTHFCLNKLRDRQNRARLVELHVKPLTSSTQSAPAEKLAVLRDILARVPNDLAECAVYYYMDEMTHDEIAAQLGCSRRHVGDVLERFHDRASRVVETEARSA